MDKYYNSSIINQNLSELGIKSMKIVSDIMLSVIKEEKDNFTDVRLNEDYSLTDELYLSNGDIMYLLNPSRIIDLTIGKLLRKSDDEVSELHGDYVIAISVESGNLFIKKYSDMTEGDLDAATSGHVILIWAGDTEIIVKCYSELILINKSGNPIYATCDDFVNKKYYFIGVTSELPNTERIVGFKGLDDLRFFFKYIPERY